IVRDSLSNLVSAMNALSGDNLLTLEHLKAQIEARDREIENPYVKDTQVMNIHNARRYIGDRLIRTAKPHRILDPAHGPLIAVRLNILTRKTLGGFETDLDGRVFGSDGQIMPGLYAAGEAAGFGGGGMHGYRSLEGSFLGGCLFSGREAGRAAARATAGLAAWRRPQRLGIPADWPSPVRRTGAGAARRWRRRLPSSPFPCPGP